MFGWEDNLAYGLTHKNGNSEYGNQLMAMLTLKGIYGYELYDSNGVLKSFDTNLRNGITNQGKNYALDAIFRGATDGPQLSPWYFGIIDSSGYVAVAVGDTHGLHSGWNEFATYSDATRIAWVESAAAGQLITNAAPSTFGINGGGTLKGVFLASNSTKSSTANAATDKIWSTVLFSANVAVVNGDTLKITYTVNAG